LDSNTKKSLVNKATKELSVKAQCMILSLARSAFYYQPVELFNSDNLNIMKVMDRIYTEYPFYGHRRICDELKDAHNIKVGRDRVLKYMHIMGIEAFYPRKKINTTTPNKEHKVYPYLLRNLNIERCNQVWAADITYIPLNGKFCYLMAIIDWHSRCILSYRISNSLDTTFCLEALKEAFKRYGKPEIFNTDQGCQFTSHAFTQELLDAGIAISMDSVGRAIDNVIIERFFRTIKYEDIYLNHYQSIKDLKKGVEKYMRFYNVQRKHSSLNKKTPYVVYHGQTFTHN